MHLKFVFTQHNKFGCETPTDIYNFQYSSKGTTFDIFWRFKIFFLSFLLIPVKTEMRTKPEKMIELSTQQILTRNIFGAGIILNQVKDVNILQLGTQNHNKY